MSRNINDLRALIEEAYKIEKEKSQNATETLIENLNVSRDTFYRVKRSESKINDSTKDRIIKGLMKCYPDISISQSRPKSSFELHKISGKFSKFFEAECEAIERPSKDICMICEAYEPDFYTYLSVINNSPNSAPLHLTSPSCNDTVPLLLEVCTGCMENRGFTGFKKTFGKGYAQLFKNIIEVNGLSHSNLCNLIGIDKSTGYRIINGEIRYLSTKVCRKLIDLSYTNKENVKGIKSSNTSFFDDVLSFILNKDIDIDEEYYGIFDDEVEEALKEKLSREFVEQYGIEFSYNYSFSYAELKRVAFCDENEDEIKLVMYGSYEYESQPRYPYFEIDYAGSGELAITVILNKENQYPYAPSIEID